MSSPGEAVSTAAAHEVPFSGDEIADSEVVDITANVSDPADELVTHRHGDRNRLLSPFIPVVDMNVRAADGGLVNLDKDVVDSHFRDRDLFQPEAGLPFGFDQSFHGFHDGSPKSRFAPGLCPFPG